MTAFKKLRINLTKETKEMELYGLFMGWKAQYR